MAKSAIGPLLVIRVNAEQKGFDIDAIDARIYCINTSDGELAIGISGESFMTVDEESGETADDAATERFFLKPGEVHLIAEIAGWEWDGHVGMKITYAPLSGGKSISRSYDFKSGNSNYKIESLNLQGRVVPGR